MFHNDRYLLLLKQSIPAAGTLQAGTWVAKQFCRGLLWSHNSSVNFVQPRLIPAIRNFIARV